MNINLVIEGGGIRGMASAVASYVLEQNGYTPVAFGGTSVGAFLASLRAYGYTAKETLKLFSSLNLRRFADISPLAWVRLGLCNGNEIMRALDELIDDATFKDLKYPLKMVATNMSKFAPEVFSRESWPGMRVSLAVRLSCSLPGFYRMGLFNGSIYWDGGLLANFPIDVFDDNPAMERRRTVGILLKGHDYDPCRWWELFLQGPAYLKLMMKNAEDRHISKDIWPNVLEIDTGKIRATQFSLTRDEKMFLVSAGIAGARKFLEGKECLSADVLTIPTEYEVAQIMGI